MEKPTEREKCIELLYDLLNNRFAGQTGIIYVKSIEDTKYITKELLKRGLKVERYQVKQKNEQRVKTHTKWLSGKIQAIVATTIEFGMYVYFEEEFKQFC